LHDTHETASLIPYLETDGTRFHVKLSVGTQDDVFPQKTAFPFLVISESRPLARIIEAKIFTDAGTQVEPVFLLIQKDEYPLAEDELRPLNNRTIDQYWQHTYTFHSHEKSESPPLILKNQMAENGALLPFHPLLFCKFKQTYFHPLCPDCGALLQQCYNDTILQEYGLQPYSGSLKRYLLCPSCSVSREKPDFYVSSLAANDPEFLKDRFELIQKFDQLIGNEKLAGRLPCIGCNEHQECYGPDSLSISRIAALSFYPFYMLIFKADSVNALDFLSLISGASYEELENLLVAKQQPGRLNCLKVLKLKGSLEKPFFFQNKDRYFLEVLYLKLSFLGELAQAIFSGLDTIQHIEFGLSIDRIWVKLSDQNSLLPYFWNFKVNLLDITGTDAKSLSISKLPKSYSLHLLGAVWFYTLLVNSKHDVSYIYKVIGEVVEEIAAKDGTTFENYPEKSFPPAFSPENIFWNPQIMSVNEDWHKFWKVSLCLGFHLLEGGLLDLKKWSKEDFGKELEKLRQQIRDNLFQPESFVSTKEHAPEDNAIYNILTKIMNDWQEGVETPSDEFETTIISTETDDTIEDGTDRDFQEDKTIILSPDGEIPEKSASIEQEEDFGETVIISSADEAPVEKTEDVTQDNDYIEETVIISADISEKETAPPAEPENDLDKTLILTPERSKTTDIADNFDHKSDEMEETVILSPDDIGQHLPSSLPHEADDFPETVIISPEQSASLYPEVSSGPPMEGVGSEDTVKGYGVPDEMKTAENKRTKKSDPDEFLEETILIQPGQTVPDKTKDNH